MDVVHLHDGVEQGKLKRDVRMFVDSLSRVDIAPFITKYIFAEPMAAIKDWFSNILVGVLGTWCVKQYLLHHWYRSLARPVVVPKPQQALNMFRASSIGEDEEVRSVLGISATAKVILRIGLPIFNKWSMCHVRLADLLSSNDSGTPDKLKSQLRGRRPGVILIDLISNDFKLEHCYRAVDCFALSANHGKSFDNLILEALSSGLPVGYTSRPLDDDTPFDFGFLPVLHVARTSQGWCEQAFSLSCSSHSGGAIGEGFSQLCSIESVGC